MKKALVIIAAVAMLGVIAAYVDPLGGGRTSHASVNKTPTSSATTTAPTTSTPVANSTNPSTTASTSPYKDGTFHGSDIPHPYGDVQISVAISGGKITGVTFDQLTSEDSHSELIDNNAAPQLKQQTLAAQSANIDGVSGATYTSQAYQQSLQSALDKAKA